ncbi:hypothetical protein DPMN_006586 [Dreissena polymorpha]|uniref:Uncharacterized protein n=1 Tax=Dreissena polymorpha TaxID=45954 RepID=A0A9D4MWT7_DREPO|nr:hypothetical protein DPMN_006586 [Dreissena polymorpha]
MDEEGNFSSVRRVMARRPNTIKENSKLPTPAKPGQVPPHLISLLKRSTKDKTQAEVEAVAGLLIKFQDILDK